MKARDRFPQAAGLVEATAVFLFFYQALRVLFSVLFGLIYDALFDETLPMTVVGLVLAGVVLALLAPLAAPRQPARRRIALLVSAVLVFVARIPLTLNDPQSRLAASMLIVAGTGVYLAGRLRDGPRDVVRALILALVADQLQRAAGHTWDVTLREGWLGGQAALSLGLCLLAGWFFRRRPLEEPASRTGPGLLGGLAWGGWLFLEMSVLNFPNALAHWSGAPYAIVCPLLLAATVSLVVAALPAAGQKQGLRLVGGGLLLVGLALGGLRTGPWVATAGLLLAQVAALLLLPHFFTRGQGRGLAWGGILFLVGSFAYAFTFTYPYTLEAFRGLGLAVVLLLGLPVAWTALRRTDAPWPSIRLTKAPGGVAVGLILVLLNLLWAWPPSPAPGAHLRIATYNIHYGYDTDWRLSLEKQAQTIEASGAEVVMLQEVDTGRPTSYMIDDALWLSRRLGMEAVYLPTLEHLSGIALLSRYPVLDTETLLLPGELEQTGILWAELDVGGTQRPEGRLNAFAIWLGLEPEERARQLDAALPFIAAHPGPAAFGGDFNSTPDSPVYARIRDAGFVDPFPALGLGSPPSDPAVNPQKRIDFVWLRDLEPLDARVLDSTASDHRPVVVEATLARR